MKGLELTGHPPSRRRFLRIGLGAIACGAGLPTAGAYASIISPAAPRSLSFYNIHTNERLSATYWADGAYFPQALRRINYMLRDFRSGEIRPIELRLLDLLVVLRDRLDTREAFHVISGYRSPRTNAALIEAGHGVARNSLHMEGRAIDIRLPGRSLTVLRQAALTLGQGGVGYYPRSDFVHVDTGRVRSW